MLFVLDETGVRFDGEDGATALASRLVTVLESVRREGQVRTRLSDLYAWEVAPDLPLHQFLFGDVSADYVIPVDLRRLLQTALDRCTIWDEQHDPVHLEADWGTGVTFAPSVAYAHGRILEGEAVACIVTGATARRGRTSVTVADVACEMHFVVSREDAIDFYRDVFEIEDVDEGEYWRIARHAYPDLEFSDDLSRQWRRFSRPYRDMRLLVTRHLSALNDHCRAAFEGHPVPAETAARMKALSGVDMSPESPGTRGNARAWRERRLVWRKHVIYCEWHIKIFPTVDRIHFHPGIRESDGRPIIGLLVDHLPT